MSVRGNGLRRAEPFERLAFGVLDGQSAAEPVVHGVDQVLAHLLDETGIRVPALPELAFELSQVGVDGR